MAQKRFKRPAKKQAPKKKVAKKKAPKKRKARSLDDAAEVVQRDKAAAIMTRAEANYNVRVSEIRQQAGIEYITDPQSRSVDWWHAREDRIYSKVVKQGTFRRWADLDRWKPRRDKWWADVEHYTLEKIKHSVTVERFEAYQQLRDDMGPLLEYTRPLRDRFGEVRRYPATMTERYKVKDKWHEREVDHPLAGLPMMPLEMGKMHEHVRMLLDMHKTLMLLRGEATARTENMPTAGSPRTAIQVDPLGSSASYDREELRQLAKDMLLSRQPELLDAQSIDIDHDGDNEEEPDEEPR